MTSPTKHRHRNRTRIRFGRGRPVTVYPTKDRPCRADCRCSHCIDFKVRVRRGEAHDVAPF